MSRKPGLHAGAELVGHFIVLCQSVLHGDRAQLRTQQRWLREQGFDVRIRRNNALARRAAQGNADAR